MSHDTPDESHHDGPEIDINKSKPAFTASFWFAIMLVGLFVASLNFITAMNAPEEGHGGHGATHTEMPAGGGHTPETGHAETEGGHADAVHDATNASDQTGDTTAGSNSENH